jgi:glycosyltransferase involved in cell wall biosynthesis
VIVSIIVPAFNEEKFLGETLAHIKSAGAAFTQIGWEIECIVCDNNSNDRTAEIARAGGATVVFEPINQISRARNTGAAAATGDWLLFVDADSHPSPELFADVAKEIQSGNCMAGGATIRWDQKNFITALFTSVVNVGFRWRRILSGAFIFVETAAFRKLGGFSHEAFAGEDVELSGRLKRLSGETGKRFVILHKHPIVTSPRRLKDFTVLSPLGLVAHIILHPHDYTASRKAAHRWYDGGR